jgi:hypothetical protein
MVSVVTLTAVGLELVVISILAAGLVLYTAHIINKQLNEELRQAHPMPKTPPPAPPPPITAPTTCLGWTCWGWAIPGGPLFTPGVVDGQPTFQALAIEEDPAEALVHWTALIDADGDLRGFQENEEPYDPTMHGYVALDLLINPRWGEDSGHEQHYGNIQDPVYVASILGPTTTPSPNPNPNPNPSAVPSPHTLLLLASAAALWAVQHRRRHPCPRS